MDRYEMMEKAKREGNKGLQMYLEAEEYGDNLALELGKKAGEERRKNIALLGLTPEQARKYSNLQLRKMAEKKSGSPDSTGTATT